jgi:predicted permease
MEMITTIIAITFPIFFITLIGYAYGRRHNPDLGGANKIIIDIALPVLIFVSLSSKSFDPISALPFTYASIALIFLSGLIAWPLVKLSGLSRNAFLPCVMFTNVGPVGIPLIALTYGPESIAYSVVLLVISNILHFTLGAGVMNGRIDWRMVYANPLVWATIFGVVGSEFQLILPETVQTSLTMIGNVLVPMMLLSLGTRLASSKIKDVSLGIKSTFLIIAIRLFTVYLLLLVIPLDGVERGAFILSASLPPAVFNFMLADKYAVEPNKVASIVFIGHFFSLAFLPIGIFLALGY